MIKDKNISAITGTMINGGKRLRTAVTATSAFGIIVIRRMRFRKKETT